MATAISAKRLQIDKANTAILIAVAVSAFVIIFALNSSKSLFGQLQYQNRVAAAESVSLVALKRDVAAQHRLVGSYSKFVSTSPNLIGGNSTGNGPNDGDNGKIVLDALPSQYDYPALTSSVEALLSGSNVSIDSIGGTDQQASVAANGSLTADPNAPTASSSATPVAATPGTAIPMPFQFSADGPYANIQNLFTNFEASIRPLQFQTLSISGNQNDLTLTATAQSYYQPQTKFSITTETIH